MGSTASPSSTPTPRARSPPSPGSSTPSGKTTALVGALSEINGPPASSRNITALVQRGKGATFVYGVIGGPGGGRGTLPDPPPGEANAFYPTDDPPYEMTWSGPVTGLGFPQVVDSRFHAKASETPTGRADGAVTPLTNPSFFTIGQATAVAHTEPVEGGVAAEAVSVVHELKVGPLLIQNIVSRAYAFVPTSGDPKGIATTVIDGAKVGDTPVQITDKGVVVADKTNPLNQEAVNKQFADAGYPQVRLIPSVAKTGDDGASVTAAAGTLEFVKQDEKFGASNPQGFSGGGFSIGGAEAVVNTRRCSPDCGGGTSSDSGGDRQRPAARWLVLIVGRGSHADLRRERRRRVRRRLDGKLVRGPDHRHQRLRARGGRQPVERKPGHRRERQHRFLRRQLRRHFP